MSKRVLMLNAGYCDEGTILALKKMGCYVITTGNRADLAGHKLADEYVYGDYSNKEQMLQIARDKKIDAICPCVSDLAVITAAYVAETLGLKGHDSYKATMILHNKDAFKTFAKELGGINTPLAQQFDSEEKALAWAKTNREYPVIVKPVDLDSGRGINRADDLRELEEAIKIACEKSLSCRIVVEPFIVGSAHAFSIFLKDKKAAVICSNDENAFVDPYRVEVDRYPASCYELVKDDIIRQVERMAQALELSDGIFHLQFILRDGKAHIIECMRRVLGNLYSIPASNLCGGFDWEYWNARAKCGFSMEDFPVDTQQRGCWNYRALFVSKPGIYQSIVIPEEYEKHIYKRVILHEPGDVITRPTLDPVGYLFMRFDDMETMKKVSVDDYERIYVQTEPING